MITHHTCQGVVVHCIDFRFQKQIDEFLENKFPKGYDRIALAGGVKELLEKQEGSITFKNLQISAELHHPKTIVLIQHEDCGAYGGSAALGSFEKEFAFQKVQLQQAAAVLRERFPETAIENYLIRLSGEVLAVGEKGA